MVARARMQHGAFFLLVLQTMIRGLRRLVAVAAVAACLVTGAVGQATVSDCAGTSGLFTITGLSFAPAQPIIGQNGTLTLDYTAPLPISAGSVDYACVLNGIPVFHQTSDLCTQTVCPITAGTHHEVSVSPVPDVTGKLACTIHWKDLSAKELLCIQMILKPVAAVTHLRGGHGSEASTASSGATYY